MLTQTQIRQHEQAQKLLTDCEQILYVMQELKTIQDEVKNDPVRFKVYKQLYDNNVKKRNKKLEQYSELLKEIIAPFEKDLHQGEAPEPQLPRISAVQLAENFYQQQETNKSE